MARSAPGVRDAREAPSAEVTLHTGDVVGSRFVVGRLLGSSDGAISYLCTDRKTERDVVIKVIDAGKLAEAESEQLKKDVTRAAGIKARQLTSLVGMGNLDDGRSFVAMEYVEGSSLARMVSKRREKGKRPDMRDVFTVIKHVSSALNAAHTGGLAHGVVTPYNVMITKGSELRLSNLAFGAITAALLHPKGKGPFHDSIYVAPELSGDPGRLSPAADVYSVAMLTAELLSPSGLSATRGEAGDQVTEALNGRSPQLGQVILSALSTNPSDRPNLGEIVAAIEDVARTGGAKLGAAPVGDQLPLEPAASAESDQAAEVEDDLFDIPGLEGILPTADFDDDEEGRYLVQRDGLDYGPYTAAEVVAQLHKDEISELTLILDRVTQERVTMSSMDVFSTQVEEYIPKREERRRKEAEARAELERKVKTGGKAVFVVGIAMGLVVLAVQIAYIVMQPDPLALPMDKAFASLDYKLSPPPKEFAKVAVDQDALASIFNPRASEEEVAKQLKKLSKRKRRKKAAKGGSDENISEVDFSSIKTNKILTDDEVNDVILAKFGGMRRCVLKELKTNPKFKGVTVKFFVRPSGTTGGVKIVESAYKNKTVGKCMVSRFRSLKFPEHGGFNKGVVFPLMVQ